MTMVESLDSLASGLITPYLGWNVANGIADQQIPNPGYAMAAKAGAAVLFGLLNYVSYSAVPRAAVTEFPSMKVGQFDVTNDAYKFAVSPLPG